MTKLKGAIIGFGNIAERGHWPTYLKSHEVEIVAVTDPSIARLGAAKNIKPELRTYGSPANLFNYEKLDFVDICTPPSTHAELAYQALSKNCHVLCEKPLTLKPLEYEALAKAMGPSQRVIFTVHNWQFAPIFQKAFSLIKEGRLGRVWHVELFTLRNNVCEGSRGAKDATDWRKNAAIAGGGILVDHGWHAFYLLQHLIHSEPQLISAKMQRDANDPESLEEEVEAVVQFSQADAFVHLTWRAQERRNTITVQGDQGTLLIDDDRLLLTPKDGSQEEIKFEAALSAGSHHADWFEALLPKFIEEIKDPDKRGTNFKEAGWCLALTTAAYQSNLQGFKKVNVNFPGIRTFENEFLAPFQIPRPS